MMKNLAASLFELEEFLNIGIPANISITSESAVNRLTPEEVATLLPEQGPLLFFEQMPVAVTETAAKEVSIWARMDVLDNFCLGHFPNRPNLPLYFIGGAAGQLCAIFTAWRRNDSRYMPLATEGSAKSLGQDLVEVGSSLLFHVRLNAETKRGFEFSYETYNENGDAIAAGSVASIAVPAAFVLKPRKH